MLHQWSETILTDPNASGSGQVQDAALALLHHTCFMVVY